MTLLIIGILLIIWAIALMIYSPVKYPSKKVIGSYKLNEIKATLTATPDKPCNSFTEWGKHIFNARNGRI